MAVVPAVLIVEDDAATRHLLEAIVQRKRFSASAVADGRSALQRLASTDYDVILLDLLLPDIDGREILAWLASTTPHLLRRVVVVTAASESEYRECAPMHLVWSVVRKPFELSALEQQVMGCCSARVATSSSSAAKTA